MENAPDMLPWLELDTLVKNFLGRAHFSYVSDMIRNNPITTSSLEKLKEEKWRVIPIHYPLGSKVQGLCSPIDKMILINSNLWGYDRDKTLFHELVHAHYHPELADVPHRTFDYRENNAIVEWLARRYRAMPELLFTAVLGFGLEPEKYDFPSYQAFHPAHLNDLKRQLSFPFSGTPLELKTLMD